MKHKRRLFLIDIMRVVCALLIYLRHSITMYGCTYGTYPDAFFCKMTSPVMTCFFILSGFSIHYQHMEDEITSEWIKTFLLKRIITIMPSYLLVVMIWPCLNPDQIKIWLTLLPVDLLGLQTSYRTLFGILHNGGTWFVSCMLLAYILYPVIKALISTKSSVAPMVMLVITHFMLMYSSVIISAFSLDGLYSNPIARSAEFVLGVAFSQILFNPKDDLLDGHYKDTLKVHFKECGILAVLFIVSLVISAVMKESVVNTVFGYLPIPSILLLLFIAKNVRCEFLERSRVLNTLSGMSYQFFLMQLFLWKITTVFMEWLDLAMNNSIKIAASFIICIIISYIIWRFYDKTIRSCLQKVLIKSEE